MNKMLQQEGGDVPFVNQRGQFHKMDQEGLATLHITEHQQVRINFERREEDIRIDNKMHSMEQWVVTMDAQPLRGHVWTSIENDFFGTKRLLYLVPRKF